MTLYTRHQLALLLGALATVGGGLAIGHWRERHPDVVERAERFDLSPDDATAAGPGAAPLPPSARPAREGRRPGPGEGPETQRPKHRPPAPGEPAVVVVDLNRASAEELTRLPGVGPALAARIVEARESDGPFAAVDDLRRVRGLGRSRLERLRALVTTGPAP
ncbi:MAG: helix-hairpin-helix domain-containing protein [Candidatus Rokubacteria bacterium]|nr:helix-hairpin-helix domain-containing protein [Candidatus Rokubacteria bacterium]MBI3825300.1 helix-hairpin-helix domain-containing protein [Candidatus Rokubacteria bacterium]